MNTEKERPSFISNNNLLLSGKSFYRVSLADEESLDSIGNPTKRKLGCCSRNAATTDSATEKIPPFKGKGEKVG